MTRADMEHLIEAVEAGGAWKGATGTLGRTNATPARHAYNGSLDAAVGLVDALLPGWGWAVESDSTGYVWHPDTKGEGWLPLSDAEIVRRTCEEARRVYWPAFEARIGGVG